MNAECIFDERVTAVTYRAPEELMQGTTLIGFIPLPTRYQTVWLELSYCIVLYTQMWRLWADEEATASRRVLEGKCRTASSELRDWFNTTYDQAARTRSRIPQGRSLSSLENRTFFEGDWNVADEGKGLLSPPADTAEWIGGKIEGLEEMFAKSLKNDALAALKKPDYYTQTQYDDQARLPVRWHEGHKPTPCFWSVRMWTWAAKGNCFEDQSMDLLFFILTQTAPKASFQEFSQTLSSLLNIIVDMPPEERRTVFVEAMMMDHLAELPETTSRTLEKGDPTNVFNTLEARLILEGYVRRHEAHAPWDINDDILWQSLKRVTTNTYLSGWQWIILKIVMGKKVPQVLNEAGPWWVKAQAIAKKQEAQNAEN
ncbi:hypothetical protein EDB19DRAFT_1826262 [Suillus lakei]|nr:hypothetical protein EDB19DRAFT_1826262 [Suillus lakei]